MRITAVSWTSFAQKVPLRWEPPLLERMKNRGYAEFQWRRLQVAFPDLPDPAGVPQIAGASFASEEQQAIDRYPALASELATASLFAANEQFTVSIDDQDGSEAIEVTRSARDITAGYLVTWRQFYATDEPASFDKVRGYLLREAKDTPAFEPIKAWSKAGGRLKVTHLDTWSFMVSPRLATSRRRPQPRARMTPRLIAKQLYGDLVHWGDRRAELAAVAGDQFAVAWERLNALEAAIASGPIAWRCGETA